MKKIFLTSIILLLSLGFTRAVERFEVLWQKGIEAYKQKNYDSSVTYLEQIALQQPQNPELYYNLGNAYYRLNKVGPAVLNFERALKSNPHFKEANDNLLLTQTRISNRIAPVSEVFFLVWWQSITHSEKATFWAIWALVVFVLTVGVALFRKLSPERAQFVPGQVTGVLVFLWLCFMVFAYVAAQRTSDMDSGVVMMNESPLLNMDRRGKPLASVPEGTTVKIYSQKGEYLEVSLPDGRRGWMQSMLLTRI